MVKTILTGAGGGSGSDINQATQLARAMVTKYGMSKELGPCRVWRKSRRGISWKISNTNNKMCLKKLHKKVDKEIRKLVDEGYNRAKKILTEKIDDLHKLAKALLTYETLTGEEIEKIINKNEYSKKKLDTKDEEEDQSSALGSIGLKPKIVH